MTPMPALVQSLCLDEKDYLPTPQPNRRLQALNRNIAGWSDGKISPVRFQLNQPVSDVAKSTRSYIKRKSKEVVESAFECIAPGQSAKLLAMITEPPSTGELEPENKVMATLVTTILSIFVHHCSKTQSKTMVPGLTTWRIDQARKHAVVVGEGISEEREPVIRYRLDGEKVGHSWSLLVAPITSKTWYMAREN